MGGFTGWSIKVHNRRYAFESGSRKGKRECTRHGSCGVGINETIVRCSTAFATTVRDLYRPSHLKDKLHAIRTQYIPERLAALGIPFMDMGSDAYVEHFLDAAAAFVQSVNIDKDTQAMNAFPAIVFEGAQGLLLDEDHKFFPHVTRSKTGLRNVVDLAKEAEIEALDVTYVTRTYMTRHGAGPFPSEDAALSYRDDTNVPHDFQGTLRFGNLDIDLLSEAIRTDLGEAKDMQVNVGLAVTHMDQVSNGGAIVKALVEELSPSRLYWSHGPKRSDIQRVCENCRVSIQDGTRCTDCR